MTEQTDLIIPKLILTLDVQRPLDKGLFEEILTKADFASVILYDSAHDESYLQKCAEQWVPIIQTANIAALIANDTRIAARVKSDGVHLECPMNDLRDILAKHHDTMIIGYGNLRDRHSAMEAGELEPDYLFFGKLGADKKAEPHPRNIALASWWADIMEIPAIVQAGNDVALFTDVLNAKADFIAIENMILSAENNISVLDKINLHIDRFVMEHKEQKL